VATKKQKRNHALARRETFMQKERKLGLEAIAERDAAEQEERETHRPRPLETNGSWGFIFRYEGPDE